jgi:hypothetical protein
LAIRRIRHDVVLLFRLIARRKLVIVGHEPGSN